MTELPIRTYGRTKSRTLKPARAGLLDEMLPALAIPPGPFDPLARGRANVWLEIGFGGGEHLAGQGARHPDVLMLVAELFRTASPASCAMSASLVSSMSGCGREMPAR